MAAAFAAAVIAIALVGAYVATHHGPVGNVPAADDKNVKAYQALISSDYATMAGSTSSHCNTIQDRGCAAAVANVIPTLQKWVADLNAFKTTPAKFAALDRQLRLHLNAVSANLNAAVAFQKKNDQSGFNLAMSAASYERAWVDPTTFAIEGSYPKVAGSYRDAVSLARQGIYACDHGTPAPADLACVRLSSGQTCIGVHAQTCESDVESAGAQIQGFLIALAQNPAPSALTTKDAQFQAALARADTGLLAVTDALLRGDPAKADAGQSSFALAISDADGLFPPV